MPDGELLERGKTFFGPELPCSFEAVLELAALGFHGTTADGDTLLSQIVVMNVVFMREEVLGRLFDDFSRMNMFRRGLNHEILKGFDNPFVLAMAELVQQRVRPAAGFG